MNKIILLMLCSYSIIAEAQPVLVWQKTYGGSNHEYAWKTIPTNDGGYAFVGFSESNDGDVTANHGGVDLWVGKINAAGTVQWSYLYGGTDDEEGYDIIQTADNGFMVAGWTSSSDGDITGHHGTSSNDDVWVLKLDASGNLSWNKCFGGTSDDDAARIVRTLTGNYYIAGSTYSNDGDVSGNHGTYASDFWLIEINAAGTLLGQKCAGGSDYDEGINMALTSDNGCILCGRTSSSDFDAVGYHGGSDMLIAKLDSSFNVQWSKCFGGTETEECNAIVQLTDGSYAGLGYSSTQNNGDVTGHHGSQGSDDFWLVKINANGTLNWAKCYGGDGEDQANGLIKTSDGGYMMCGLTNSINGDVSGFHTGGFFDPDIWAAKTDAAGNFQWQRCCGGSGQDESFNVFEEGSGLFVVTGFTYSSNYDVTYNRGSADGWILKVSGSSSVHSYFADEGVSISPNPSNGIITLRTADPCDIVITDVAGNKIFSKSNCSDNEILDVSDISAGSYFIHIYSDESMKAAKIIKL